MSTTTSPPLDPSRSARTSKLSSRRTAEPTVTKNRRTATPLSANINTINNIDWDDPDPYHVIALAVRLEEATGNKKLLLEPLETSSLLKTSGFLFQKALEYLKDCQSNNHKKSEKRLRRAITPLLLSGLIMAQQRQDQTKNNHPLPSPSELLLFTMTMRKQALQRMTSRASNFRFQMCCLLFAVGATATGTVIQSLRSIIHTIQVLGFVGIENQQEYGKNFVPCNEMPSLNSKRICETSEAMTWFLLKDYLAKTPPSMSCTINRCPRESRQQIMTHMAKIKSRHQEMDPWGHAPYAAHTVLTTNSRRKSKRKQIQSNKNHPHELQWLGDSILMQMIRQVILSARVSGNVFRILDVGCGVGSFFYAMLPGKFDNYGLDYEGITFSPVETKTALDLLERHDVQLDGRAFFQRDLAQLELPEQQKFDVILCVEHILQVPNEKFKKLTEHLVMNGIVIIVTDVIHSPRLQVNDTAGGIEVEHERQSPRRSWYTKDHLTHSELVGILTTYGLTVQVTRDLGLEYSMPQLVDDFFIPASWWSKWRFDRTKWFANGLRWLEFRVGHKYPATKRLIRLWRQGIMIQKKNEKRRKAHEDGDLIYVMYIASKK
jgi:2-polyprenyl-3-methyl-5-hydroxy-6-metoxy-1,4-benzoquinol methylase